MTDNVDSTPTELEGVFLNHPLAKVYGVQPEEKKLVANSPVIPGFILVTPCNEKWPPQLINVQRIEIVNATGPHTGPETGAKTNISFDDDNFMAVKETFEEVLLLMAVALN